MTSLYATEIESNQPLNVMAEEEQCVTVAVRCRPLFKFEIERGEKIGKPVSKMFL